MPNREEVLAVIKHLRQVHCLYGSATCDCKFGGAGLDSEHYLSEETGCPELRMIQALLLTLRDDEFSQLIAGVRPSHFDK